MTATEKLDWHELDVASLPKAYQDRFYAAEEIASKARKASKEAIDYYTAGVADQIATDKALVVIRKWDSWRFAIVPKRRTSSKAIALQPKK